MESALKNYIHKARLNGGIVNRMIVINAVICDSLIPDIREAVTASASGKQT